MKRGLAWLTWWEWTNGRGLIFRGFRLGLSVLRFLEQRAGDVLRARASVERVTGRDGLLSHRSS